MPGLPEGPRLTPYAYIPIDSIMSESESRLKQTRSTVRLSAVVTTLADNRKRVAALGTHVRVFFSRSELELGPRLWSDMTGYICYFWVI